MNRLIVLGLSVLALVAAAGSLLFVVDQRQVGADACFLYGRYVLGGAIGGICCDRVRV